MPILTYKKIIYHLQCETIVDETIDLDLLEDCHGSDDYESIKTASKDGWQILKDNKTYCRSCFSAIFTNKA